MSLASHGDKYGERCNAISETPANLPLLPVSKADTTSAIRHVDSTTGLRLYSPIARRYEARNMPLPPGLDPVTAGRFGLWLLGQRNHRAAQRRRRGSLRVYPASDASRFARLVCPWIIAEYPGAEVLISQLCGVSEVTAEGWLRRTKPLPSRHARVLADYVERFDGVGVARELRAYADERDKRIRPPRVRRRQVRSEGE